MRFIGSKKNIVGKIEEVLNKHTDGSEKKQEKQLYDLLDNLSENNIRFALSNVLEHKGIKNESLIRWSEKYNVHHLNYSYSNSSHNTTHLGSDEVLITNFKIS